MTPLEPLTRNAAVRGILPDALVTVVSVQWFGAEALEVTGGKAATRGRTGGRPGYCCAGATSHRSEL